MVSKTSYYPDVYDVVRCIPAGRVTSYGLIAVFLQLPTPRMVGYALYKCPADVPAHRVLNHKGKLTAAGAFLPERSMKDLLKAEGHTFIGDDQVADFRQKVWDPLQEIL